MILGFIKNYIPTFMKQIEERVGILTGIDQSLVNLQNIKKVNIMIGIVIVGTRPIKEKIKMLLIMVKLESCL